MLVREAEPHVPHDWKKVWVVVGSCVNEDMTANAIWSVLDLGRRREREVWAGKWL